MKQRSVMKHQFSQVPRAEIQRSSFDRSHGLKTAFDAGLLIPIFVDEVLPGDSFNLSMTGFGRLATPIFPVMDNMYMETFFFFVPNRLLWDNWQKFCGEQDDPGDSIDFTIPKLGAGTGVALNSIFDYMGLPVGITMTNHQANALHFRAYNLIWNEWFRDQNLQDSVTVPTGNGADAGSTYTLLRRGKRHDYFTSCLTAPQKGVSVSLPLGTTADVMAVSGWSAGLDVHVKNADIVANWVDMNSGVPTKLEFGATAAGAANLVVDLSNATAATVNSLREAVQIQRFLERDARSGTRYTEIVKSHFSVTSPDARLQRPEFLGGGSSPIGITSVANTSDTATYEQGELSGYGTVVLNNHGFTKSFTEHGVLIGLLSVRADLTYSQGVNRMWYRQTRYDFFWPVFAHLGEQSVLNREIWSDDSANDILVFGYQERYAEYRYKPSMITGIMRPDAAGTLAAWHLSQDFAVLPVLNASFIEDNPPIDRVIAVPSEPHFIFDGHFDLRCARPMPLYGVPGMIDHF